MGLFIRKSIEALQAEANATGSKTLKRVLGPWSLVALGVGVIIGAGLFSITGTVAGEYTGPAITLSFAIAAIGCCFAGLCYAEFASMIPVAGSAYTYSYATMGELVAWIIGWDLVLEYTVAATTVSISWSRYLVVFLQSIGIELPHALSACPWDGGIINIPAMLIVVMMSIMVIAMLNMLWTKDEIAGSVSFLSNILLTTFLIFLMIQIPRVYMKSAARTLSPKATALSISSGKSMSTGVLVSFAATAASSSCIVSRESAGFTFIVSVIGLEVRNQVPHVCSFHKQKYDSFYAVECLLAETVCTEKDEYRT